MIPGRLCCACRSRQTGALRSARSLVGAQRQQLWLPVCHPSLALAHNRKITLDAILLERSLRNVKEAMTAAKRKQRRRKTGNDSITKEQKLEQDQNYWKRVGKRNNWFDFSKHHNAYSAQVRRRLPAEHQGAALHRLKRWYIRLNLVTNNPEKAQYYVGTPVAERLLQYNSVELMQRDWESMDEEKRQMLWETMIISVMKLEPQKVHEVLRATMNPLPRGYCLSDAMWFSAQKLKFDEGRDRRQDPWRADEILRTFESVYLGTPTEHVPFRSLSQKTVALLAKKLPPDHVNQLYNLMSSFNGIQGLNLNTRLHVARALARSNRHKKAAFDIIAATIAERGDRVLFDMTQFNSVITGIFSHVHNPREGDEKVVFDVRQALESLIETDYTPNLIVVTSFLDALCRYGEFDDAIRLAGVLSEMGVPINNRTFGALFKSAKASLDAEQVAKTLDFVKVADAPVLDAYNNALHAVFHFSEAEKKEKTEHQQKAPPSFLPILRLYAKAFKLEALQTLIPEDLRSLVNPATGSIVETAHEKAVNDWRYPKTIVPVIEEFFESTGIPKLDPTTDTLAVMIRAYIWSRSRPHELWQYYEAFRYRLAERTMPIRASNGQIELVENYATRLVKEHQGLIHDTLISALARHDGLVRQALVILGDMISEHNKAQAAQVVSLTEHTSPEPEQQHNGITDEEAESSKVAGDSELANKSQKMQKEAIKAREPEAIPSKPVHPPPSVFAFTIVINSLFNQAKRDGIEKQQNNRRAQELFQVMLEQDITPNLVTWNVMVRGWAKAQNVAETVKALQGLEAAGFSPNDHTYKAFAHLGKAKQRQALRKMDGIIEKNKAQYVMGKLEWEAFVAQKEAKRTELKEQEEGTNKDEDGLDDAQEWRRGSPALTPSGMSVPQNVTEGLSVLDALEQQMATMRRGHDGPTSTRTRKKKQKNRRGPKGSKALEEATSDGDSSLFDEVNRYRRAA